MIGSLMSSTSTFCTNAMELDADRDEVSLFESAKRIVAPGRVLEGTVCDGVPIVSATMACSPERDFITVRIVDLLTLVRDGILALSVVELDTFLLGGGLALGQDLFGLEGVDLAVLVRNGDFEGRNVACEFVDPVLPGGLVRINEEIAWSIEFLRERVHVKSVEVSVICHEYRVLARIPCYDRSLDRVGSRVWVSR